MRDYSTPEVKSFTTTGVSVGSVEVSRDDMIRWFQEHADHDSLLLMDTALSVGFDRLAPETNIADVLSSMSTLRSLIEGVA